MELVRTAVDGVTELLQKSSSEMAPTESCDLEPVAKGDGCSREKEVRFTDDLRTEDFNYIMNESSKFNFYLQDFSMVPKLWLSYKNTFLILVGVPQVPLPGNIVFHHGNGGFPPTMTWQYGEPRAITKLYVLPVPFTITTEEDAPVDIKV